MTDRDIIHKILNTQQMTILNSVKGSDRREPVWYLVVLTSVLAHSSVLIM